LRRYREAFERLSVPMARQVWPSLDQGVLAREFASLRSQRLVFDACEVTVGSVRATASCRGTASYVSKAGMQQPTTELRRWTFALRNSAAGWIIVSTEARP
jgi:hypothetical protein